MWRYLVIATLLSLVAPGATGSSGSDEPADALTQSAMQNPLTGMLESMTDQERSNAIIELVLEQNAGAGALAVASKIERLWNQAEFADALKLFDELASLTGLGAAEIHVSWKVPVTTTSPERQGTDVQISTRDSVRILEMEVHHGTGNLIALVIFEGDGSTASIETRLSTNGGATWAATHTIGMGSDIVDASAAVWEDHCYLAYNYSFFNNTRLIRFDCATGAREQISGSDYLTIHPSQTIRELKLSSSDDYVSSNDYLYLALIETDDDLIVYRITIGAISTWQKLAGTIGNCDRGLDLYVSPSIWFPIFVSYIHTGNNLVICKYEGTSDLYIPLFTTQVGGVAPDETCLDLYGTNIVCLYEYYSTAQTKSGIYGWYSDNLGDAYWYQLIDDWGTNRYSPSITMRGGGGIGIAYSTQSMYPVRRGNFKWRSYDSLTFYYAPEVPYSDDWTAFQQDIEYLGNGEHGIAYVSSDFRAWFDHLSGCCMGSIRGNVDYGGDDQINVSDLTYLVAYLFQGGDEPGCLVEADVEGSTAINVSDLTYLVAYLFQGGPAPAACP